MAELQLKIVKNSNSGVWGKAIDNLNKVFYSSGGGFFNILINSKRSGLVKAFLNSEDTKKISSSNKQKAITEKYEKAYENYIEALEKYITDTIYNKVKKKVSTLSENNILSYYYEINSLKGSNYEEYRYRLQLMLLSMDWNNILSSKGDNFVEKYKKFYVSVIPQLYKSIMRHYAIQITNTTDSKETIFSKIYDLTEDYIKNFIPYDRKSDENVLYTDTYKKFVENIDTFARKESNDLKRDLHLLELSKLIFVYSFPIVAAEECYQNIIERARNIISNTYISADKFEVYNLLLDAIESYNYNVLSLKTVWDNDAEKEKYLEFWNKFMEYKKLESIDFEEYKRLREVLFITNEIKNIKKIDKNYSQLLSYYRERMKQQHGLRYFKNSVKVMKGIWKTKRRIKAD